MSLVEVSLTPETFANAYPKSTCASPTRWISGMNTSCFTRSNSLTASITWVYFPPYPHLPDALVDPLGRVALFPRQRFVFFDDLSDPLQVGAANLRLGAGLLQTIPGGSGWTNIFFNVSQPIPSLRRTSRFFLPLLNTSSRNLVHHSMSVYTPPSSFAIVNLSLYPKEGILRVSQFSTAQSRHSFGPPFIPTGRITNSPYTNPGKLTKNVTYILRH